MIYFSVSLNCIFEIDNFEKWKLSYKFDFIYKCELNDLIYNCERLCKEAFEYLKSDRYFELQSFEHSFLLNDDIYKTAVHTFE